MPDVFDIQDFITARLNEADPTGGLAPRLLEIHQPTLVTWHPVWFCGECRGSDEPEHHMASSYMSFDGDGKVIEEQHNDGPLLSAGADWPCDTVQAVAAVWEDHPDHRKWIPGVRERASTLGTLYVLQGGPASDGGIQVRAAQAPYLDDPAWGPNTSTMRIWIADPQEFDGKAVLQVQGVPGVYRYRAATDTIEWDEAPGESGPITGVCYGFANEPSR